MAPNPEDQAFKQYRASRDPEAMARVFDLTAPKLLLVARHLTDDAATAEDQLQATFLQAIREADSYDPKRPVMPWLSRILINRCKDHRRSQNRSPHKRLLDGGLRSDDPGPAQKAQGRELHERVARGLDSVPPLYRHVLILRLVHGLNSKEIGHSLGRSPATVRSQVKRGLEMLRKHLPRELRVPAVVALLGENGLAAIRAEILMSLPAATTVATTVGIGAVLSVKKLALGVLATLTAAALALFAALQQSSLGKQALPTVYWEEGDEIPVVAEVLEQESEENSLVAASRTAVEARSGAEAVRVEASLRGRVVEVGGIPIGGAEVCLEFRAASGNRGRRRVSEHVRTGPDGTFGFVGSVYDRDLIVALQVTHGRHAPTLVERQVERVADEVDLGDIPMLGGGSVLGRITDQAGNPIPGAEISLDADSQNPIDDARHESDMLPEVESNGNGLFRLEYLMAGAYYVGVSARHHQEARVGRFTVEDGAELNLGDLRLGPGFEIVGVVYTEDGAPVERARVELESSARGQPDFSTRTDEQGRFAIDHVPPGLADVDVEAGGFLYSSLEDIDPESSAELVIRLHEAMQIQGQVVDATTGQPLSRFAVRARRLDQLPELRVEQARNRAATRMGELQQELLELSAIAEEKELEDRKLRIERSMLAAERRLARTVQEVSEGARGPSWPRDAGRQRNRAEGRFRLEDLQEGVYVVDIEAPNYQRFRTEPLDLRRSDPFPDLTIPIGRGMTVAGRVVTRSNGSPIPRARIEITALETDSRGRTRRQEAAETRADGSGRFSFGHLLDGFRYSVNVRASGYVSENTAPFLLDRNVDGLEIRLGATGALEGQVLDADPERVRQVRVVAISVQEGDTERARVRADGTYTLRNLSPGPYAVQAYLGDVRDRFLRGTVFNTDVEVGAGETVTYDLALSSRPTGGLEGMVFDNGQPAAGYRVRLQLDDPTGNRSNSDTTEDGGGFSLRDILPGRYVLEVQGPSRRSGLHRETVFITAGSESDLSIHLATGRVRGTVTASDAGELRGSAWILPGLTVAPDDLESWLQSNPGVRVDIRNGSFDSGRVVSGPFLLVVDVEGRERTVARVQVLAGQDTTVEIQPGSKRF